jgi:hypothetical protein
VDQKACGSRARASRPRHRRVGLKRRDTRQHEVMPPCANRGRPIDHAP